jgi:Fe-S cluster biosynthesis and repair protein YggX
MNRPRNGGPHTPWRRLKPAVELYGLSGPVRPVLLHWRNGWAIYNESSQLFGESMPHMVVCAKYKQEMEGLDETPFDSDFGQKIYNHVSKKAWGEWIERQKMLLNEYRLQPWTKEAQEFLVEQMQEFFFGEGSALPKEFVPPAH